LLAYRARKKSPQTKAATAATWPAGPIQSSVAAIEGPDSCNFSASAEVFVYGSRFDRSIMRPKMKQNDIIIDLGLILESLKRILIYISKDF